MQNKHYLNSFMYIIFSLIFLLYIMYIKSNNFYKLWLIFGLDEAQKKRKQDVIQNPIKTTLLQGMKVQFCSIQVKCSSVKERQLFFSKKRKLLRKSVYKSSLQEQVIFRLIYNKEGILYQSRHLIFACSKFGFSKTRNSRIHIIKSFQNSHAYSLNG